MAFFGNKRKDFSIQPPKQQVDGTPFYVTDSANIDFTFANLNLTANLTQTGVTAGTYGDATHIPILTLDSYGRVTGVTTTTFSASGVLLQTNSTDNDSQTILNLTSGTDIQVVDLGGGVIKFNYTGTGGNAVWGSITGTLTDQTDLTSYLTTNYYPLTGNPSGFITGIAASQGLKLNPSNSVDVQLGSDADDSSATITGSRYIDAGITGSLKFKGSINDPYAKGILHIVNQHVLSGPETPTSISGWSPGRGVTGFSSGDGAFSAGVFADALTQYGLWANSRDGIAIRSVSKNNIVFEGLRSADASLASSVVEMASYTRNTQGVQGANGVGIKFKYDIYGGSSNYNAHEIVHKWVNVINGSQLSQYEIWGNRYGTLQQHFTLKGTGQLQLNNYTGTTFDGTAAYSLGVNSSGDVITFPVGTGTGTVISVSATVPSPTTPALSVLVTNPTTTPAIAITANGTTSQYVRGDGSLETTVTKTSELYNDGDNGTSHFISLEDLPSNLTLYATNVASGISTYTKAVSSLTDPSYNITAVDIPVGPLTSTSVATYCGGVISSANIIIGNPGIFTMSTIGNIRRTGGTAQGVFYYEIYKRDSGGTETLIVTSSNTIPVSASAYTEFNAAALFNNGVFTATDRVVIKFYGFRLSGGSDPSFDFQFGGTAPVRTTLPIPLVVTPANGVTSVGTGTGLTGGTITNTGTISLNTKLAPADTLTGNAGMFLRVKSDESAVEYATVTSSGNSIQALTSDVTASASLPSQSVAATLATSYKSGSAGVIFDGAGGVITANTVAYAQIPYNGTITGWQIVANALGGCTIAVRKGTFSPFPPTTVIVTPVLLTSQTASGTGLSIAVSSGDWLSFTITGVSTVAWVNLTLSITKTV